MYEKLVDSSAYIMMLNLLFLFLIMITGPAGEVSAMKGDVKLFSGLLSGGIFKRYVFK